jgi:TFIIF-interacting CTD phosphatases, including NLI-interacting factor
MERVDSRLLLILDLDETLVFSTERSLGRPSEGIVGPYSVYFRPGPGRFIREMSRLYRLAVWTSSGASYAREICSLIFPRDIELEFLWTSDRCTLVRDLDYDVTYGAKRLRKLRKRYSLDRIVVVDDSPEKHAKNYGNLVRVAPYEGLADDELDLLRTYLQRLSTVQNVRSIEKRNWRADVR